jgi:hypothetical protein
MPKKSNDQIVTGASIEALVICDLAQITQEGKLNLVGIFERMYANTFPMQFVRFFVAGMITGEPLSTHTVSFALRAPTGEQMMKQYDMETRLGYNGRANVVDEIRGVVFDVPGTYSLFMSVDRSEVKVFQFDVMVREDKPLKPTSTGN